mmetsp:Transcript_57362/g.167933  ORF Transcript_57362/g.167933 Transcript_57362/m.167933 type:complete len:206 (+) Transcript_57362:82-699(+)
MAATQWGSFLKSFDSSTEPSTAASTCSEDDLTAVPTFHCHECLIAIEEDMPVYMGLDSSYCSTECRQRGFAAHMLRDPEFDEFRSSSSVCSSSLRTDLTESAGSAPSSPAGGRVPGLRRGMLGWIITAGLRKLTSFVEGMEPLHSSLSAAQPLPDGTGPSQLSLGRGVSSEEHLWDLTLEERGIRGIKGMSSSADLSHLTEEYGQ